MSSGVHPSFISKFSAVKELCRIAELSAADFRTLPNIQQIVDDLYSSVQSRQLHIPDTEVKRFTRKLATVEDRIEENPLLSTLVRLALLDKLERIEAIISGKQLHDEFGLVNPKESHVLNLWHHKHVYLDEAMGELLFSPELAKKLNDTYFEEILTYSSPKNRAKIAYVPLEKYENLGLEAPAILARLIPHIAFESFACMTTHPERFCDYALRVEGIEIKVNRAFLSIVSNYFKKLFTTSMRRGQEEENVTVIKGMQYAPLRDCIQMLTGAFEVPADVRHERLQQYLWIANELMSPMLLEALEPAFLPHLQAGVEKQENAFEVVDSLHEQFQHAFQAGVCLEIKDELKRIAQEAADVKIKRIIEKMPKKGKSQYLALAISGIILSVAPLGHLKRSVNLVVSFTGLMVEHYVPPLVIIPILEDLRKQLPDDSLLLTWLAIQHLRAENISNWQEAKRILEFLIEGPCKSDKFGFPYLLLADCLRLGTKGIPPNPQAAKDVLALYSTINPDSEGLGTLWAQILFKDEVTLDAAIHYVATHNATAHPFYLAYLQRHHPDFAQSWERSTQDKNGRWIEPIRAHEFIAREYCLHDNLVWKEYHEQRFEELAKAFMFVRENRLLYSVALDMLHDMPKEIQKRIARHIEEFEKRK